MCPKKQPDPNSETYLLDKAMEKARKDEVARRNKNPKLWIDEVSKIADEHPEIIKESGETYFMAFAAGVIVERYGISVKAAARAISAWSSKK